MQTFCISGLNIVIFKKVEKPKPYLHVHCYVAVCKKSDVRSYIH